MVIHMRGIFWCDRSGGRRCRWEIVWVRVVAVVGKLTHPKGVLWIMRVVMYVVISGRVLECHRLLHRNQPISYLRTRVAKMAPQHVLVMNITSQMLKSWYLDLQVSAKMVETLSTAVKAIAAAAAVSKKLGMRLCC